MSARLPFTVMPATAGIHAVFAKHRGGSMDASRRWRDEKKGCLA